MGNDVTSFNPRARVGRDLRQRPSSSSHNSFNPRARVGRDGVVPVVFGPVLQVSIHAPAWGATAYSRACERGRTRFNPRARVGRDPAGLQERASRPGFNPRARVGRDLKICMAPDRPRVFQSTRPRGARPDRWYGILRWTNGFNPRARVGRDISDQYAHIDRARFQSTRPRGARPEQFPHLFALREVSIHAPAWGATRPQVSRPCRQGRFNPRARVGRDDSTRRRARGNG